MAVPAMDVGVVRVRMGQRFVDMRLSVCFPGWVARGMAGLVVCVVDMGANCPR